MQIKSIKNKEVEYSCCFTKQMYHSADLSNVTCM